MASEDASLQFRLRHFQPDDLIRFNNINLDPWTEMYSNSFYLEYMVKHKQMCFVAETADGVLAGYLLAKMEGPLRRLTDSDEQFVPRMATAAGSLKRSPLTVGHWHSHISAVSVAPEYRQCGIAGVLMDRFEELSNVHQCWFADLFVRCSNSLAIKVYEKRGYIIYRRIKGYYSGQEDAFDMRLPLSRDVCKLSIANAGYEIRSKDVLDADEYDETSELC